MRSRVYSLPSLIDYGAVIHRTLGDPVSDTHESAFEASRPDDSLTVPTYRPIADKLIGGTKRSFDPFTGTYVDETSGEAN